MIEATKIEVSRFPESDTLDTKANVRIREYGEASYENAMAVLSHELHNFKSTGSYLNADREEMVSLIREYLKEKKLLNKWSDEDIVMVAERPIQSSLFDDFFSVPFPGPKNPRFTFIDLFAGIGGFRLAMQAHGGECVFSSEWNKYSRTTYMANYANRLKLVA